MQILKRFIGLFEVQGKNSNDTIISTDSIIKYDLGLALQNLRVSRFDT